MAGAHSQDLRIGLPPLWWAPSYANSTRFSNPTGLRDDGIDVRCLFDGPIKREPFLAYVERALVPSLTPGDVVILNNLGSHKSKPARWAIRAVGAGLI